MFVVLLCGAASGCRPQATLDVRFFYLEICPSCESYRRAREIENSLQKVDTKRKELIAKSYNLIDPAASEILVEEIEKRVLPDISRSLPLLFINGTYYVGYDDMETAVKTLSDNRS